MSGQHEFDPNKAQRCKNCGRQIAKRNTSYDSGWTHIDDVGDEQSTQCLLFAEPKDECQ